jgi:hypothetical protein
MENKHLAPVRAAIDMLDTHAHVVEASNIAGLSRYNRVCGLKSQKLITPHAEDAEQVDEQVDEV